MANYYRKDEEEYITSETITELATQNIYNFISKKDKVKNVVIDDLGINYIKRFLTMAESISSPLNYIYDDVYDLFLYTKPHFLKILENPRTQLIKDPKMIRREKVKSFDNSTFNWLQNKPGANIREKLANLEKIKSTVTRFSFDNKENQVVKKYLSMLIPIMWDRIEFIHKNPNIFGVISSELISQNKSELNRIKVNYKDIFEEVRLTDHSTPNNTLIGNFDYSSIWQSYLKLKNMHDIKFDLDNNKYFLYLSKLIMLHLMSLNGFEYIEDTKKLFDKDASFIIFKNTEKEYIEYLLDCSDTLKITINSYSKDNGILFKYKKDEIKLKFSFDETERKENRGIPFIISIFGADYTFKSYADMEGFKDTLKFIDSLLKLNEEYKKIEDEPKQKFNFLSFTSFDNKVFLNNGGLNKGLANNGSRFLVNSKDVHYISDLNVYTYNYSNAYYLDFLSEIKKLSCNNGKEILIYDIKDTFDEFSSIEARRKISSAFSNSYPVWRSILAAESVDSDVNYILDTVGKEFYVAKVGKKNKVFVHYGPCETPIFVNILLEKNIYELYIKKYNQKYNTNIDISTFLYSGRAFELFNDKREILLKYTDKSGYVYVSYDQDIVQSCIDEFVNKLVNLVEYRDDICVIVPDFIPTDKFKCAVNNKNLIKGASKIRERIIKNEITWYERLPELSLEVIKNGCFDTLPLIENKECENIIGKKVQFNIETNFTLVAGEKEYILPLNKSFVGEQNKSYVAKIKHKSFPLSEDTRVKLILNYSFGNDNNYELIFIPLTKAPFLELKVDWCEDEPVEFNKQLPHIKDIEYTNERKELSINEILPKMINNIKGMTWKALKSNYFRDIESVTFRFINEHQRLLSVCDDELKIKTDKLIEESKITQTIDRLRSAARKNSDKNLDYNKREIAIRNCTTFEEATTQITLNRNLFLKNKLKYPETCYGRYFAFKPDDKDVVDNAYNYLIQRVNKTDFYKSHKLRRMIGKLTSCTTVNHLSILNLTKTNPMFTRTLLETIVSIIKKVSVDEWNFNLDSFYIESPKQKCLMMKYCVEILISYLFVRDSIFFTELQPGGKIARELIYYIKRFNVRYQQALKEWPDDRKDKPLMKLKYRMDFKEIPDNLYNMWIEGYCLILFLSGDERANLIQVSMEE